MIKRGTSRGRGVVSLSGGALSCEDVELVARELSRVRLDGRALARIERSRRRLESVLMDGEAHYGINTGFGSLSRQRIDDHDLERLQQNLIRSHAAGIGPPLPAETVRATMLLLAASLSRGLSGVRPVVVQTLARMLNAGVTPVVPEVGSVGASGDLAPLAHIALVMMGEGEAQIGGRILDGGRALTRAGIPPVRFRAKEGLALINGTHLMAARGALLVRDFERVFDAALGACAASIDACKATDQFLDPRIHAARAQPGQSRVAAKLRGLLAGSRIIPSHKGEDDPRVQDPYSIRCAPQVLGAAWDAFGFVIRVVEQELGAVTDNPLIFDRTRGRNHGRSEALSGGNFHGMPIAVALDVLAIALAHVAGIAERRVYFMLGGFDPDSGLPPFLTPRAGLQSGLMIAQYAAAACCNELIGLAGPASVANISTSAGMEDYNSFGPRSAAKAARAMELCRCVVATELLCACEALERHRPLRSGRGVERIKAAVRRVVPRLAADRPPGKDVEAIARLIQTGRFDSDG